MQSTVRTKPRQIFKKNIQRKLIREYRTYSTRTMFFTTIALRTGILDTKPEIYDEAIDFLEEAEKSLYLHLIDPNDDKRIVQVATELYNAMRSVFIYNCEWE